MDPARSLHSVFTDLAGERDYAEASGLGPEEVLAAGGHPDLPEGLVAEAVVNYADTAPYEVAEHLAPYVRANSAVPVSGPPSGPGDPGEVAGEPHWYALLTTAPPVDLTAGTDVLDASALEGSGAPDAGSAAPPDPAGHFGQGHGMAADDSAGAAGPDGGDATPWASSAEPDLDGGAAGPGPDAGAAGPDLDALAAGSDLAGFEPGPEEMRAPEAHDAPPADDPDGLDGLSDA